MQTEGPHLAQVDPAREAWLPAKVIDRIYIQFELAAVVNFDLHKGQRVYTVKATSPLS